jgi:hypothetical protein
MSTKRRCTPFLEMQRDLALAAKSNGATPAAGGPKAPVNDAPLTPAADEGALKPTPKASEDYLGLNGIVYKYALTEKVGASGEHNLEVTIFKKHGKSTTEHKISLWNNNAAYTSVYALATEKRVFGQELLIFPIRPSGTPAKPVLSSCSEPGTTAFIIDGTEDEKAAMRAFFSRLMAADKTPKMTAMIFQAFIAKGSPLGDAEMLALEPKKKDEEGRRRRQPDALGGPPPQPQWKQTAWRDEDEVDGPPVNKGHRAEDTSPLGGGGGGRRAV